MSLQNPLTETFAINNRINLYLLNALLPEHLADLASDNKGRNVGEQFAHIHNVRLMWLKASEPALLEGLTKIEKEQALDKAFLQQALQQSATAMEQLIEIGVATGKIKGFKPHATAFVGYLVAHESHHRGQIMLCLKQNGHLPDKKIQFGLWEWGVR